MILVSVHHWNIINFLMAIKDSLMDDKNLLKTIKESVNIIKLR